MNDPSRRAVVTGLGAITPIGNDPETFWTNLTAGRRTLTDLVAKGILPEVFAANDDPDRLVPIVAAPEELLVAVAGDPNRANAFVLSNDGRHGDWTTATIDRSVSLDLACRIDRPDLCG